MNIEINDVNINIKHKVLDIGNISKVTELLRRLVIDEKKNVLMVCDIDDTLIRPDVTVGSDVWFSYSMQTDEHYDTIVKKLCLVYALLDFKGVEQDTDELIELMYKLQNSPEYRLKYMCLTSRNIKFHGVTKLHFESAGYVDKMVQKNTLDIREPLYLEYHDKKTNDDFTIRYLDNICCATGGNKGIITTEILNRYYENPDHERFDVVIFIDDSKSNINKVQDVFEDPVNLSTYQDTETYNIHYTYMEEHKNKYSIHSFTDDAEKIDKLLRFKNYLNE